MLAPNGPTRKRGQQMGHDSEARQHCYVNLRLRKKPEKALPLVSSDLTRERPSRRQRCWRSWSWEERCTDQPVRQEADASRDKNAEDQQTENGVNEPSPNGDWQAREAHAGRAHFDRCYTEV